MLSPRSSLNTTCPGQHRGSIRWELSLHARAGRHPAPVHRILFLLTELFGILTHHCVAGQRCQRHVAGGPGTDGRTCLHRHDHLQHGRWRRCRHGVHVSSALSSLSLLSFLHTAVTDAVVIVTLSKHASSTASIACFGLVLPVTFPFLSPSSPSKRPVYWAKIKSPRRCLILKLLFSLSLSMHRWIHGIKNNAVYKLAQK